MAQTPAKRTTKPKPRTDVAPTVQRISRYDKYILEQKKAHNEAKGEIARIDLELAERHAEIDALLAERGDWASIQQAAANTINGRQIEGRTAPQQIEGSTDGQET